MEQAYREFFSESQWQSMMLELSIPPRQEQICRGILSGMSDKQLAAAIGVEVPTIRTHLSRLFAHLEVQDRVELLLLLFRRAHINGRKK